MTLNSEQIVRKAYQIAEDMDLIGWVAAFTEDGTFTDESIGSSAGVLQHRQLTAVAAPNTVAPTSRQAITILLPSG